MKNAIREVLLTYPALDRPRRHSSFRTARLCLRQGKYGIDQILEKLEANLAALPAPSPRDYERMAAGEIPLTPEALLAGALAAVLYQLAEASYDIDGYFGHTPTDLRKGFVDPRLLQHLKVLVEGRRGAGSGTRAPDQAARDHA